VATRTVHLRIVGLVQGVSFRASARDQAVSLGLKGWVRNVPDGAVEAHASGDEGTIETFVAWFRTGPPEAQVTSVVHVDVTPEAGLTTFEVRW